MSIVSRATKLRIGVLRADTVRLLRPRKLWGKRDQLIVFDPGLSVLTGHHFEWARFLKRELRMAFDVTVYSNVHARTRVLAALNACPVFRDGPYPEYRDQVFLDVYRSTTSSMLQDLQLVDSGYIRASTLAVVHTFTVFQLGGLAEWYTSLPSAQRPKLLLQFQFPLEFFVRPEAAWPQAIAIAKRAADMLTAAGPVRFACNSQSLAHRISQQLSVDCALLPLPVDWPDVDQIPGPRPGAVFGFFGALRAEKGAELLARAVPSFVAHYPDARFIIHAPAGVSDETAVRALKPIPQVQVIRDSFRDKGAYFASFCQAACILLPYDPTAYAHRTSGIFIEALGTRRLIVTTKGTWMESELRKRPGTGLLMRDFTTEDLTDCLVAARLLLLRRSGCAERVDRDVVTANSPSAFCNAMTDLMRH